MTEFYKEKFSKFYNTQMLLLKKAQPEVWRKKQKQGGITATTKDEMDLLVDKFIAQTFGPEILDRAGSQLSQDDKMQLIDNMMMVVFSHRYCKNDVFISEALASAQCNIDFSIVRDVMYKYSKKAQDRFFAHPIEAFLFAAFALSDEGIRFLQSKPDNQGDAHKLQRLQSDLGDLKNQAVDSLRQQAQLASR